jgi:hypothetical protein
MKYQNQVLGVILLSLCIFVFVYKYPVIDVEQFVTNDLGYQGADITSNQFEPPPKANFGVNIWRQSFNISRCEFDKRYKLYGLPDMPHYPELYTTTGEFIDEGPVAGEPRFP